VCVRARVCACDHAVVYDSGSARGWRVRGRVRGCVLAFAGEGARAESRRQIGLHVSVA
jgi:hypothetical protein